MSQWSSSPPQLCSISLCDISLSFEPRVTWPAGLPAVAVNQVVLAGFSQNLVFNHQINPQDGEAIASLFRSLYFELSFVEMSALLAKSAVFPWFPRELIVQKFGWQPNEVFFKTAGLISSLPLGLKTWAADKKLSPSDFAPLLAVKEQELKFLFLDLVDLNLSRSLGVKALELGIELILMGLDPHNLRAEKLVVTLPADQSLGEAWVQELKRLRFPETFKRDQETQAHLTSLPWPGTSQARWSRQGDRTGIELKLFVSQPSDLKKYLQSLGKVHELLEKDSSGTTH